MKINGTIQEVSLLEPGIDLETGDPIDATTHEGNPVECLIKTIHKSNHGKYEGGTFTSSSYEVLIETQEYNPKRVKLVNSRNEMLGEFAVQSIEYLDMTGRIKITV